MKKYIIILSLLFIPFFIFSKIDLSIKYEVQSKNVYLFKFTFTSDKLIDKATWKIINEQLLNQLQNNKSYFIQAKTMPEYISEIINLISNQQDKQKAINIYKVNNLNYRDSGYGVSTQVSDKGTTKISVQQSYDVTLEFNLSLKEFIFESLEFNIDNQSIKSKQIKL